MNLLYWKVQESCCNCKFSVDAFGGQELFCHRHAPICKGEFLGQPKAAWPIVSSDDWCGEFAKSKNA